MLVGNEQDRIAEGDPAGRGFAGANRVNPFQRLFFYWQHGCYGWRVEFTYKQLGGNITVIIKDGEGHYPLAPEDPAPVVDFITRLAT